MGANKLNSLYITVDAAVLLLAFQLVPCYQLMFVVLSFVAINTRLRIRIERKAGW